MRRLWDGISTWTGVYDVVVDDTGTDIRFSVDAAHVGDAREPPGRLGHHTLTCEPASLEDLFLAHYARGRPAEDVRGRGGMSSLTGTGTLLRLAWRRDRVLIPATLLALTALSVGSAQATLALYPDRPRCP